MLSLSLHQKDKWLI